MNVSYTKLLVGGGLSLLLVVAVVSAIRPQSAPQSLKEKVAEGHARRYFLLSRFPFSLVPYDTDVFELDDGWLDSHDVFAIRAYFLGQRPASASVRIAVGEDRESYRMPGDFNDLLVAEGIAVRNDGVAGEVAQMYLELAEGVAVVMGAEEIPGSEEVPPDVATQISPLQVNRVENSYRIRVYTWKRLGGRIEKWEVDLNETGVQEVLREVIAERVGSYGLEA